jgi:hypothetical protein
VEGYDMTSWQDGHAPPPFTAEQLPRMRYADLIGLANRYLKLSEKATDAALFPLRAQIIIQEMARRTQNRQTKWIIRMTAVITVMTAIIMVETICPHWLQSTAQSLLIRASQVIDLWWPSG